MKALQFTAIDQLNLVDIEPPTPAPDQVLIRTGASTICTSDLHDLRGNPFNIELPIILGHEGAGTIAAVGAAVRDLAVGDRVAAHPVHPCLTCDTCRSGMGHLCPQLSHFGLDMQGTFAEYFVARADRVRRIPPEVSFELAALTEPVCVCLEAIHQASLTPNAHLLIMGDGPFGVMMARLARKITPHVTIAGRHSSRLAFAQPVPGIVTTPDTDPVPELRTAGGPMGYDAVILAVASREAIAPTLHLLRPKGRLVIFAPLPGDTAIDLFDVLLRELEIVGAVNDQERMDEAITSLSDPETGLGDLITHTFAIDDYAAAFATAEGDRLHAMKVAFLF